MVVEQVIVKQADEAEQLREIALDQNIYIGPLYLTGPGLEIDIPMAYMGIAGYSAGEDGEVYLVIKARPENDEFMTFVEGSTPTFVRVAENEE